ncbi:endonuclease/exonuclease/phosphatase family protein [Myxococcota bacterium]|nr:endonuclease/exonuclease/phosphatase family protein [Myxococcota bacterium]MBU1431563.1 endonuclease/exonuclease/phosphatase family protein [Myxococcota bacterium]MBU1896281.1 endonuclease/exonuclease/phosphatase family protein [Myxococcota bacterium]
MKINPTPWLLALALATLLGCEPQEDTGGGAVYFDVPTSWLTDSGARPDWAPWPDQGGAAGAGGVWDWSMGGGLNPPPDAGPEVDAQPIDAAPVEGEVVRVRVMAANITSGNGQAYEGPGIRIMQGLKPDIILIQEFNYDNDSDADIRELVRLAAGPEFSYYREPRGTIPNGIISRWPITLAGSADDPEVNNRGFAWARIEIPGHRHLWAFSLHLLTANSSTRNREGQALVSFIRGRVPDGDYLVLGGDFNTDRGSESVFDTLSQVVSRSFTPADHEGNPNTNASRSKPYDWVLANQALNAFHVPLQLGSRPYPQGLVFDSRVYRPLSDVAPVQAGDSGASNMQHMAVIKEFELRP